MGEKRYRMAKHTGSRYRDASIVSANSYKSGRISTGGSAATNPRSSS
ncbi:MAG: hypothetical protein M0R40_05710 [Firmicutes bacterium]|nr:hypothetical protein [Bacillota bacterium]